MDVKKTNQTFDKRTKGFEFEALVIYVEYYVCSLKRKVSYVKKAKSVFYVPDFGNNDANLTDYPEAISELNIHYRTIDDIGSGTIDVRKLALSVNNRRSITENFINTLGDKLVGKTIDIVLEKSQLKIKDSSILKV